MSERDRKIVTTGDKIKMLYGSPEQKKQAEEKIIQAKLEEQARLAEYNKIVFADPKEIKPIKVNSDWLFNRFKEISKTILPKDIYGNRPEFIIDEENHHFIKTLVYYFSDNPKFLKSQYLKNEPSLSKGLLILGTCGFGKTATLKAFQQIFKGISYKRFPKGFMIESCNNMAVNYKISGAESYLNHLKHGNWLYDDLGTEQKGKHYGSEEEVIQTVLEERYNLFVDKGNLTHATSNLTLQEINERYKFRIASRIPEMFNVIVVNSKIDRRKQPKNNQK